MPNTQMTASLFTGELNGAMTEAKADALVNLTTVAVLSIVSLADRGDTAILIYVIRLLDQLRVMESLGGSAGFSKWLQDTQYGRIPASPPPPDILRAFADSSNAQLGPGNARFQVTVNLWFAAIYFTLEVNVINTSVSGNGFAWGAGLGYIGGTGAIEVTGPLDRLREVTGFAIIAGSAGAGAGGIMFYTGGNNSEPIAAIILAGGGVGGGAGGGGQFTFR